MRYYKAVLTSLLLLFVLCLSVFNIPSAQADVNDFYIRSFTADYYLERNEEKTALLKVDEVIEAVFPDFDQNHGILRAIPKTYNGHTVSLEVNSVTKPDGSKWNYNTSTENDNLVLKIGDADKYVQGQQTFRISYTLKNVIAFHDTHDEFYWDINGDQWLQRFGTVTARIHIPKELADNLDGRYGCFAGSYGFNEKACLVDRVDTEVKTTLTAAATDLGPRQTLTTVLGFDKGTFQLGPEIAAEARKQRALLIAGIVSFLLPIVATAVKLRSRWRRDGKDPAGRGVIIPEYLPPKNLNALSSDVIINEKLQSKAVSALIVELAVKKYLHLYEIPKKGMFGKTDYEIEIVKDPGQLDDHEKSVLNMFFTSGLTVGSKVKLSTLKNKLHSDIQKLDTSLTNRLFQEGYFRNDPHKTRKRYITAGVVMLIAAFVISFLVVTIPFGIGLGLSGLLVMLVSNTMPARSEKGVAAKEYLFGLKEYMKLAEAERLKVLQSPEGAQKLPKDIDPNNPKSQVKLFEKLLPYAMLFGIEKEWAKQFEHLYNTPPDWYSGNWQTFSTVHLASSLGGFSAASATSFTSPSSSGSSGFSGGSSGGGGGGGGGGGW